MSEPLPSYATTRNRGPTVSYAEVERAARAIMAAGARPTGKAVLQSLGRGSPNHITECMHRFWKDQSALNAGDPLALSRLPPELAAAAVAQWEQSLRLAQQTAQYEDNAARARLEQLRRDTETKGHSVELREKEWDLAARVRERALADTRQHVNMLMQELALGSAELRARDSRIADLESQITEFRRQLTTVIARAVVRNRRPVPKKPRKRVRVKLRKRGMVKKRVPSKHTRRSSKR